MLCLRKSTHASTRSQRKGRSSPAEVINACDKTSAEEVF
jgi:hypothetical protein